MAPKPGFDNAADWPAYADPLGRYSVRYPPGWGVMQESADRVSIREPGIQAELAIEYAARDCGAAEAELRQRRLNYYLVGESSRVIAGRQTAILELRDTVSNRREFCAFVAGPSVCCQLRWTRPAGSSGQNFESIQEAMLSTFDFITHRS